MAAMGHFDPFPPRRLNGRCPFSQPTFIGTHGDERDAPITAVRRISGTGGAFIRRRYSDGRIDNLWSPVPITV